MSKDVESSPDRKQELINLIVPEYEKFHKLHKKYKINRIRFERIYRKLDRHNIYFLEKIWAFTQDMNLIHKKIDGILNAPLARTPQFWENYAIMFPSKSDRERMPEQDLLEDLYSRFKLLISNFLKVNEAYYARKKSPPDPVRSSVQSERQPLQNTD